MPEPTHTSRPGGDGEATHASRAAAVRPLWRSKMLWIACVMTLVGLVSWGYAAATAARDARSGGVGSGQQAASLTDSNGGPTSAGPAPAPRLIDDASPAMSRFGASFIGGFFVAYVFRRFIKWTLLIAGGITLAIVVLKKTGVLHLPWESVESDVHQGVEWAKHQAGAVKTFLTGYLPSTASAVVGAFFGARRS